MTFCSWLRNRGDWKCRTSKWRTKEQGWKTQDWNLADGSDVRAGLENAGLNTDNENIYEHLGKLPFEATSKDSSQSSNMLAFLSHLQNTTIDSRPMADMRRVRNGIKIRRPKEKRNIQNDARIKECIERYDHGSYSIAPLATVSTHTRDTTSCSCWMLVTLRTSTSDHQLQQQPTQQDESRLRSVPHRCTHWRQRRI